MPTDPVVAAVIDCMTLQGCLGIGRADGISVLYERLPAVVLLKDGYLLHSSIWREYCVKRVNGDGVHLIFNLRMQSPFSLSNATGFPHLKSRSIEYMFELYQFT